MSSFFRSATRKNGASALVDQGIISGLNLLTFLMLARWMPSDTFGIYVLAFSIILFAQTIQHALITRAHNVIGASMEAHDFGPFTRSVLLLVGVFSIVLVALALLIWIPLEIWTSTDVSEAALGLAIALVPWLLQDAVRRVFYSSERIKSAAWNSFISYSLQATGVIIMMRLSLQSSQVLVFSVMGFSSLAAAMVGLFQLRKDLFNHPLEFDAVKEDAKRLWTFGKWLTTGELVGWMGQNGNTWIIGALMGAPLVAAYRAATYITNLLNPLDLAVSNYLPVKAAQIHRSEGKEALLSWIRKMTLTLCVPYAVLVAGISLGSYQLLDLFYDERYVSDLLALVLTIAAVSRLFAFAASFFRLGLMAEENTRPILSSQFLALVLYSILGTAMIAWLGIAGAPLARIGLYTVVGLFLYRALSGRNVSFKATFNPSAQ